MQVHKNFVARGPIARNDNMVVTETADEVLLYDTGKHHIHHLNATTAAVWRLCDGQHSVVDLAREAGQALGAEMDEATVRLALTRLDDAGLLRESLADELRMSRMSRRTFMQRAGVAGAIAVPAIASTTSPAAGQNFSTGCGVGCTPGQLECFFAGYECWVCFPTSFTSGYCIDPFGGNSVAARSAGPSEGQAAALERQYLIDEGYLDEEESGAAGEPEAGATGIQSVGDPVGEGAGDGSAAGTEGSGTGGSGTEGTEYAGSDTENGGTGTEDSGDGGTGTGTEGTGEGSEGIGDGTGTEGAGTEESGTESPGDDGAGNEGEDAGPETTEGGAADEQG